MSGGVFGWSEFSLDAGDFEDYFLVDNGPIETALLGGNVAMFSGET